MPMEPSVLEYRPRYDLSLRPSAPRSIPSMATSSPHENQPLYFFPERHVTAEELHVMLHGGSRGERCHAVSCMLRYAQWEDIWDYVSRDEVRDLFDDLDLPDSLRTAWARMLKIETVAT